MKEVASELSLKEIHQFVMKLTLLPLCTSLPPLQQAAVFHLGPQIQILPSILIVPKAGACHTHHPWSRKPNIYLGRSSPKSVSQNQGCVCEEYNDRSHLAYILESICVLTTVMP